MRIRWHRIIAILLVVGTAVMARDRINIEAALDTENQRITGSIDILLDLDSANASQMHDLRFRLYPNLFCDSLFRCGIEVESLFVAGRDLTGEAVLSETDMEVTLPEDVLVDADVPVRMRFSTYIPNQDCRISYYDNRYCLVSWFPMPAPRVDGEWLKIDYRRFIEPAADLCDITATFRFPDSLQLIAPGVQGIESLEGTSSAELMLEAASDLPLLLASDYLQDSTQLEETAVKIFYRESQRYVVDTVRRETLYALEYMSENVLAYPFDELILVIDGWPFGGAVELPRMILLSPHLPSLMRMYQSTVIHEVIHQWFYGIINSNQATAPWMDEAVTEYFTEEINHAAAGGSPDLISFLGFTTDLATFSRLMGYRVFDMVPVGQSGELFYDRSEYYAAVYRKGAKVIGTLTALMGSANEELFWREYAATFAYKTPQPDDFVRLANKYLPSSTTADARTLLECTQPVDWQVVSLINTKTDEPVDPETTSLEQETPYETTVEYVARHPLGFPVDFRVEYPDGSVSDTVLWPTRGMHSITFAGPYPARAVIIDPDYKYAIDVNLLNNSLVHHSSRGAGLRLFSGITFLVESLFSSLWGF